MSPKIKARRGDRKGGRNKIGGQSESPRVGACVPEERQWNRDTNSATLRITNSVYSGSSFCLRGIESIQRSTASSRIDARKGRENSNRAGKFK